MGNEKANPKLACLVLTPAENPPGMSQAAVLTMDTLKRLEN